MKWMSVVLVAALLVQVVPCAAQEQQDVLGALLWEKVRITAPSLFPYPFVGTLTKLGADSLVVERSWLPVGGATRFNKQARGESVERIEGKNGRCHWTVH